MKTAIVLSGGGAKGAYQIGVWYALKKMHVNYDIVTGTSVGALNGCFMVQKDFIKALYMWYNIDFNKIFDEEFEAQYNTSDGKKEIIKKFAKGMILDGGMNVSKLENIVDKYVNIRKFYKSRIDFGLVTVNLTNLKARSMTKKNIPQNKLKDYLLASATCFPAFKTKKIDDKTYIDGGYYDNLPINLAVEMGADNIIAVDLRSVGLKRRIKYKDIKLTVIVPRNDLGSFLVFNPDLARRAMKFGYNDTMKVYKKLDGNKFTFRRKTLDAVYNRYSTNISSSVNEIFNYKTQRKSILKKLVSLRKYNKLILNDNEKGVKKILLDNIEYIGKIFELDESRIYDLDKFNRIILSRLRRVEELNYSLIQEKIKVKKVRSLLNNKTIIKYIYEKIENCNDDSCKKELCIIAGLLPKEFLAALYLSVIS